jgi:hypothetical protein
MHRRHWPNAYEMGVYINELQRKAKDLIRLRTRTIKAFKTRNLEINFKDVAERIRVELDRLANAPL